ncbi:MAG: sigma-70 family RNA polymerase sigma factor [Phycisphaerales bacterium]|nr:sigma-70 family RNA polymerase sigma factor [Phycisphaerales bacterium]
MADLVSINPIDLPSARPTTTGVRTAYDRIAPSLYRYFLVRVASDSHLADDLMQQLWVQALSAGSIPPVTDAPSSAPPTDAERWLFAVARNLVRTLWRNRRNRPATVTLPDDESLGRLGERLSSPDFSADKLNAAELRDELLLALTRLCHADQELIVRHYFDGESHAALAARMGVSERAVEGRLYRARAALRETLRCAGHDE